MSRQAVNSGNGPVDKPLPKNARVGNPLAFLKHCIHASRTIPDPVRRHIDRFMAEIGNPGRLSPQEAEVQARRVHARLQLARLEHTLTAMEPTSPRYPMLSKSAYYWAAMMDKLNAVSRKNGRAANSGKDNSQQQGSSALWKSKAGPNEPDDGDGEEA